MSSGKELLTKYFKKVSVLDYYSPGSIPYGCPMPKYYVVTLGNYELKLVQAKIGGQNFLTMKVGMSLVDEWVSRSLEQLETDIQTARGIIINDAEAMLSELEQLK